MTERRTVWRRTLLVVACAISTPLSARAEDVPPAALDDFFKGAVVGLDGTKVKLRYDFSTPEQMKDWIENVPWPIAKDAGDKASVAEGRLAVRGSTGAKHAAEWVGDLKVTCRLIPDGTKDIGSFLATGDSTTDYLAYSIGETYFHGWDNKAGGDTGMMKFAKHFSDFQKGGYTGFRYMAARFPQHPPQSGKPIAYAFGRKAANAFLVVDDLDMDSLEPGNKMKFVSPGFYAIKSAVAVDDVVIEGTLSTRWLQEKRVALKTARPLAVEVIVAVDPAVTTAVEAYKTGKDSPTKLVDLAKDPSRSEADRQAVAGALKTGPRTAVNAVVDLLYNPEEKVRALGIEIVKGLIGKNYGYDSKAGEKSRSAAIKRMRKDLDDHPELLKGSGG